LHYLATCLKVEEVAEEVEEEEEEGEEDNDNDGEEKDEDDAEMKDEEDGEDDEGEKDDDAKMKDEEGDKGKEKDEDAEMKDEEEEEGATTTTTTTKRKKPVKKTKAQILTEIVNLLLQAGIDTELVSENGERALEVAILHRNWTLVRILLERKPNLLPPAEAAHKHYENKNVLHLLAPRLMTLRKAGPLNAGLDPISLLKLLAACPDFTKLAAQSDSFGRTPIHALLEAYCRYSMPPAKATNQPDEEAAKYARAKFVEFMDLLLTQFGKHASEIVIQQVGKKAKVQPKRKKAGGDNNDYDEEEEEEENDEDDDGDDDNTNEDKVRVLPENLSSLEFNLQTLSIY